MTDIAMPKLSDSMEEGTILKWLKAGGEQVSVGDELVEIETDKATVTYESEAAGVLEIITAEGESVSVGSVIARLAPAGAASEDGAPAAEPPKPAAEQAAPQPTVAQPLATASPVATGNGKPSANSDDVRATPVARRLARQHGVDLTAVEGSGPRGRVTRADVAAAAGLGTMPERPTPPMSPNPDASGGETVPAGSARADAKIVELTRLQRTVARRMSEAKATIPHFQVETEVLMDEAIALRARLKELSGGEPAPSLNDFVVKAAAAALRRDPRVNGSYRDSRFELHARVNIGVAVAADDALVVPTVTDVDTKSLAQIAREMRQLAARVRAEEITPTELSGGTFTVSNLGMFGMTAITPVINPPQAAILGVGALRPTVVRGAHGEIADRTLMTLTLSCDHRILYGADAARFLAEIKRLLESPLRLAL